MLYRARWRRLSKPSNCQGGTPRHDPTRPSASLASAAATCLQAQARRHTPRAIRSTTSPVYQSHLAHTSSPVLRGPRPRASFLSPPHRRRSRAAREHTGALCRTLPDGVRLDRYRLPAGRSSTGPPFPLAPSGSVGPRHHVLKQSLAFGHHLSLSPRRAAGRRRARAARCSQPGAAPAAATPQLWRTSWTASCCAWTSWTPLRRPRRCAPGPRCFSRCSAGDAMVPSARARPRTLGVSLATKLSDEHFSGIKRGPLGRWAGARWLARHRAAQSARAAAAPRTCGWVEARHTR